MCIRSEDLASPKVEFRMGAASVSGTLIEAISFLTAIAFAGAKGRRSLACWLESERQPSDCVEKSTSSLVGLVPAEDARRGKPNFHSSGWGVRSKGIKGGSFGRSDKEKHNKMERAALVMMKRFSRCKIRARKPQPFSAAPRRAQRRDARRTTAATATVVAEAARG